MDALQTYDNLFEILERATARDSCASSLGLFEENGEIGWWTRDEVLERAVGAAYRLRAELGLERGHRLLCLAPSTPALAALYFGAMRAGIIVVPLDPRMSADAAAGIVKSAAPSALAASQDLRAEVDRLGLSALPATTVEALTMPLEADRREKAHATVSSWPTPGRGDLFEVIYTSGTTGTRKGVMLTHGNILSWVEGCTTPFRHVGTALSPSCR